MTRSEGDGNRIAATVALVTGYAAAAAIAFGPALTGPFVADDYDEIWKAVGRWTPVYDGAGSNFRPVHIASLSLDARWSGGAADMSPLPFRLTNLAIHVATALALVAATRALVPRIPALRRLGREQVAFTAGALFLVSPARTEPVSWIAARADLLVTLWTLVTIWCWLRADDRDTGRARRWRFASIGAFAFALGSKESAVVVPVVLALIELARGGRRPRAVLRAVGPYLAMLPVFAAVRWAAIHGRNEGYGLRSLIGPPLRWPLRLAEVVVRSVVPAMPPVAWVAIGILLAAASITALHPTRRPDLDGNTRRALVVAAAATVVLAAPSAGLGTSLTTTLGERLAYLPAIVPAIVLSATIAAVADRRRAVAATAVLLAVSLVLTVAIDTRWRVSERMTGDVVDGAALWPRDRPVILLDQPNDVAGTIAARNLFPGALALRLGWEAPSNALYVRSWSAGDGGARVEVTPTGEPRTWDVLLDAGSRFLGTDEDAGDRPPGVHVTDVDRRHIVVRLDETVDESTVWYFDGLTMRRLG